MKRYYIFNHYLPVYDLIGKLPLYLYSGIIMARYIKPVGQTMSALGITSNSILLYTIFYSKKLKDPSYIFVTNIASSDLITSIQVMVIFTTLNTPLLDAVGNIICKMTYCIYFVSYTASTLSLSLISIYRLKAVSSPHRFKQTSYIYKHSIKLAIVIWIFSILFAIPLYPVMRYVNVTRNCDLHHVYGGTYSTIYFSSSLLIDFILPGITIIVCYVRTASKLNSRIFTPENNINIKPRTLIRLKELFKFYGIVTAIYMILSWPLMMVLVILSATQETQASLLDKNIGTALAFTIGFFSSNIVYVVNPIMFMVFDKNIKSDIKKLPVWIRSRCNRL